MAASRRVNADFPFHRAGGSRVGATTSASVQKGSAPTAPLERVIPPPRWVGRMGRPVRWMVRVGVHAVARRRGVAPRPSASPLLLAVCSPAHPSLLGRRVVQPTAGCWVVVMRRHCPAAYCPRAAPPGDIPQNAAMAGGEGAPRNCPTLATCPAGVAHGRPPVRLP
jgi:hypothetical protein